MTQPSAGRNTLLGGEGVSRRVSSSSLLFSHLLSDLAEEAFNLCVDLLDGFYDDITDKVAWYAQTYGVVYDLESFSFRTSVSGIFVPGLYWLLILKLQVLWNNEMTAQGIKLMDWSPSRVDVWSVGVPVGADKVSSFSVVFFFAF